MPSFQHDDIDVTSHDRNGVSNYEELNNLFDRLFKLPSSHYWPLVRRIPRLQVDFPKKGH